MSLQVRLVGVRILIEAWRLHDILQHAAHVAVHILDIQLTILHTGNDFLHLGRLSGFHEVITCINLSDGGQTLTNTNPVSHHDTFIAPVVTQNLRQQVVVTHRILTIDFVIRSHNRPRVTLTDGNLEALQVELTGCTL